MRARNQTLERQLLQLAARAGGFTHDHGLRRFADDRTMPGPVRDRDFLREALEELADAANYIPWSIEQVHADYLAGDPAAMRTYSKLMRALTHVVAAWVALTEPD